MTTQSKRKHPRIPYQGSVSLQFQDQHYPKCTTQNLSLIGMWILGFQEQPLGTQCNIDFHDAGSANRSLRIKGEIVRVDEQGTALLFVNMNVRSYNDLETLILEHAGDALIGEDDFLEDIS